MDQLETLIDGFEMLIAYQCIDLPDKITSLIFQNDSSWPNASIV